MWLWVKQLYEGRRLTILALFVLVLLGVVVWLFASPLRGSVSATLIGSDGSVRAVSLSAHSLIPTFYQAPSEVRGALIAAVPSPAGDRLALVARDKDKTARLVLADAKTGARVEPRVSGDVTVPQWSLEGRSVAVAVRTSSSSEPLTPESWQVLRTVTNGDSLAIGRGYRPHPSQNQRTFALTSQGIALLSYSDTPSSVVVASPVPVPLSTPFTVSADGMRVAWVAPADRSLQVFDNVNGYFVPALLKPKVAYQSLVFSPTGTHLLGTTQTGATTTVHLISASSGSDSVVGEIAGSLILHTWRYEK